jgi:hypothetical protein
MKQDIFYKICCAQRRFSWSDPCSIRIDPTVQSIKRNRDSVERASRVIKILRFHGHRIGANVEMVAIVWLGTRYRLCQRHNIFYSPAHGVDYLVTLSDGSRPQRIFLEDAFVQDVALRVLSCIPHGDGK